MSYIIQYLFWTMIFAFMKIQCSQMYSQMSQRLKPTTLPAQSDQSLHCPHEESLGP